MSGNRILQALRNHPFRIILAFLAAIVLYVGYDQLTGYQQLNIELKEPDSGAVSVLSVSSKSGDTKQVASLPGSASLRLRKGSYVVASGDSKDFAHQTETVDLKDQPVTVVIDPGYSYEKLDALLEEQRPEISSVIAGTLPNIGTGYLLGPGELFHKGEWYGTVIYPNLSAEERRLNYVDVYHVVVNKVDGKWVVATIPPEIVLSSIDYPDIPFDILSRTNLQNQPDD